MLANAPIDQFGKQCQEGFAIFWLHIEDRLEAVASDAKPI
jgi:hypothetical protein